MMMNSNLKNYSKKKNEMNYCLKMMNSKMMNSNSKKKNSSSNLMNCCSKNCYNLMNC